MTRATSLHRPGPGLAFVLLLASTRAAAAPPKACTDAYEQAQLLRKQGHAVAAREQLRLCAQASCPKLIVSDCTQWLDDVQSSLPSVVPVPVDEAGANLADATVSIDGGPFVPATAAAAIDVDPGPHHFAFERPGGPRAETDAIVAIGEKNKRVAVTLRATPSSTTPATTPSPSRFPFGTVGLVVMAVGVVGLGVGVAFAAEAAAGKSDASCPGNVCQLPSGNPSTLHDAWVDGNVSTAFFVAGGVLAASGATMWLVSRSRHDAGSAWVGASAVALRDGGGVVLVGGF